MPQPCASAAAEASRSSTFTVRPTVRLCRRLLASELCSGRSAPAFDPSALLSSNPSISVSESKCLEHGVKEVVKGIRLGNKLQRKPLTDRTGREIKDVHVLRLAGCLTECSRECLGHLHVSGRMVIVWNSTNAIPYNLSRDLVESKQIEVTGRQRLPVL